MFSPFQNLTVICPNEDDWTGNYTVSISQAGLVLPGKFFRSVRIEKHITLTMMIPECIHIYIYACVWDNLIPFIPTARAFWFI